MHTADGKLQTKGELSVVRVDRNVEIPAPSEAYYGPVYGDPSIHRVAYEATFVSISRPIGERRRNPGVGIYEGVQGGFSPVGKDRSDDLLAAGVQDENCRVPSPNESYNGARCRGHLCKLRASPSRLAHTLERITRAPRISIASSGNV